jgi:hypothetical protein
LYVAPVEQMVRFPPLVCEFLRDSFDDDDAVNFIRDALEAVDPVFLKSEINNCQ